jgi:hypothetical protein
VDVGWEEEDELDEPEPQAGARDPVELDDDRDDKWVEVVRLGGF